MTSTTLTDKAIVVVGGTTGIGFSAARSFVSRGAKVVITGRHSITVAEAGQSIGENSVAIVADARTPGSASKAIETCLHHFGQFDGLYHVAGGSGRAMGDGALHELSLEGWNDTFELNCTSLMLSNKAAVEQFLRQGNGGSILNMGSVLGYSPAPHYFATHAYAATKAAIIGFSKSIAAYYAANNIRVNVIAPALVETPMARRAAGDPKILSYIKTRQPLDGGRIGNPEDLDGLAAYFMSDESRFTTGQVIAVDGGWSVSEGQYQ